MGDARAVGLESPGEPEAKLAVPPDLTANKGSRFVGRATNMAIQIPPLHHTQRPQWREEVIGTRADTTFFLQSCGRLHLAQLGKAGSERKLIPDWLFTAPEIATMDHR